MAFNPFEFQRQMFTEFEKSMAEYLQKTMRDPEFMKLVAQGMQGALDYRGTMKVQIEQVLKTLQLPTEASQEKLYGTLHDMESRVLDLEEQVLDLRQSLLQAIGTLGASLVATTEARAALHQATAELEELKASLGQATAPAEPAAPKRAPRPRKSPAAAKPAVESVEGPAPAKKAAPKAPRSRKGGEHA